MATLVIAAAAALGSTATTAIGAGIYLASTAATVASIGYSIYSALNQPTSRSEGPRLGDLKVQSSARGVPIPKVWGSMRIAGNLIDGKKYEERTEESVGGKGFMGGGGGTQVTYNYFADFAISLCEGPITGVRRIWMNNKLWYTAADDASDTELEASADHERFGKLYLGTTSQLPDPTLEAIHGAGNVPPYRRTAYIVFTRLPLENFGNAIPNVSVEVCNTPKTFTVPTIHPGAEDGGLFGDGTQMVRDPETGRIFKTIYNTTYMRVFNSSLSNSIRLITLPGKETQPFGITPCYVPTTREIWAPYPAAAGPSVAIIDPDALVIKAILTMSMVYSHGAFYNPVRDEVLVHNAAQEPSKAVYFNPQTRVGVLGSALFPVYVLGGLYIAPHEAIAVWGEDNRIRLINANTYGLIAEYYASEFGTEFQWVS
jgi:hypothetical protein